MDEVDEEQAARVWRALDDVAGTLPGLAQPGLLEGLRNEWPE